MSEQEVQDPVVQEEVKEELHTQAEATNPTDEVQEVAEEVIDLSEDRKTIPKDRFDQVWARSKKAEARLEQLQADLQREKEERIRLEERAKVQNEKTEPEYSWEQLDAAVDEGRITKAWAREYKETKLAERITKQIKAQQVADSSVSTVLREIDQYKQLIPDVMTPGSDNREKYEREYKYLVRNGSPDNHTTQLAAVRAAFGAPETIKARQTTKQVITSKEPLMETHAPSRNVQKPTKSFEDGLPEHKRDFYKKLMKHGAIKTWKDAEEIEKRRGK